MDPAIAAPKCRRRFLIAVFFAIISVFCWEFELSQIDYNFTSPLIHTSPAELPECTKEASEWPRPNGLTPYKYETLLKAEKILAFLISKLDEIGAPVTLMFGTMLREFRNGTDGPCLQPDYNDKDFDIVVFPEHFHYIYTFEAEILAKFGWVFRLNDLRKQRLFTTIETPAPIGDYFQIDIYGFHCNASNDLVFFPWDMVTIAKNALLPVRKHKLILSQNDTSSVGTNVTTTGRTSHTSPGFFMPYNTPCVLHNIYGSDYMTPKSGKSSQAKWGKNNGRPAYYNPKCSSTLTAFEEAELKRQLMFCQGGYIPNPTKMIDGITNVK